MPRFFLLFFLCMAFACRNTDINTFYQQYKFDKQVVEKLPVYDSLVTSILKNYAAVQQHISERGSYRYIDSMDKKDLYGKLPPDEAVKVTKYFTTLGPGLIYGFDVYKDSTVKIYIRDANLAYHVYRRERLSYYPDGKMRKPKTFPYKDTLLNKNWQYWTLFDDQGAF